MQNFGGNNGGGRNGGGRNNGGRGNGGGRFFNGRGRNDNRGGGGGRNPGGRGNNGGGGGGNDYNNGETPVHNICPFYLRDQSCRYGDKCHNSHAIVTMFAFQAHQVAVKCCDVMDIEGAPRIITGSADSTIKFWNIANLTKGNTNPDYTMNAKGAVVSLEVSGNTILYSSDEPLEGDSPDVSVGMVHLAFLNQQQTVPLKRSEQFPYTHAGQVRSFKVVRAGDQTYVVSAGADNIIRTWRYNNANNNFDLITTMEGHIRAVTCLLLSENMLWSGAMDNTIRVWDIGSGACVGVLKGRSDQFPDRPGHTLAVTCLETMQMPASATGPGEAFVLSGGADGELKVWKMNGEFAGNISHGVAITALKYFNDACGALLLVGLVDGRVMIRSVQTLELLATIDGSIHQNKAIWSITQLGSGESCFITAGESGFFAVLKINGPLEN